MLRVILIILGLILIGIMIVIIRYTKAEVLINKLQGKGVRMIVILGMIGCCFVSVGGCGIILNTFFPNMEERIEALVTTGVMILLIYILYKLALALKSDEYKEFVKAEEERLLAERDDDVDPEFAGVDFGDDDEDYDEDDEDYDEDDEDYDDEDDDYDEEDEDDDDDDGIDFGGELDEDWEEPEDDDDDDDFDDEEDEEEVEQPAAEK